MYYLLRTRQYHPVGIEKKSDTWKPGKCRIYNLNYWLGTRGHIYETRGGFYISTSTFPYQYRGRVNISLCPQHNKSKAEILMKRHLVLHKKNTYCAQSLSFYKCPKLNKKFSNHLHQFLFANADKISFFGRQIKPRYDGPSGIRDNRKDREGTEIRFG